MMSKFNKTVFSTSKSYYLFCNVALNTTFALSIAGTILERQNISKPLGHVMEGSSRQHCKKNSIQSCLVTLVPSFYQQKGCICVCTRCKTRTTRNFQIRSDEKFLGTDNCRRKPENLDMLLSHGVFCTVILTGGGYRFGIRLLFGSCEDHLATSN